MLRSSDPEVQKREGTTARLNLETDPYGVPIVNMIEKCPSREVTVISVADVWSSTLPLLFVMVDSGSLTRAPL
jgi:hypothetical protein